MNPAIIIYGNVPSSKNTRQIVHPKTKRARWNADKGFQGSVITAKDLPMMRNKSRVIASKLVRDYEKRAELQWISHRARFHRLIEGLRKPYRISFRFVRDSNRKFDYINAAQIVQDLMVRYEWLDDDNADEMIPVFEPYRVDKLDAGVVITVQGS